MASPRYKYKPLDHDNAEIRLLLLFPSRQFSSQIRCSIFKTTIGKAPKYTALSYCWGEASNPQTIELNDMDESNIVHTSLSCTPNLYSALQQLRQNGLARPLWVDAICINQEDKPERSSQVMLMRDIYEQAGETFVWLGDAADSSELAIGLIKAWANSQDDFDAFVQRCPFAFEEKMWKAVKKLFERPWWERVWVYQEFVVSQEVSFLCGPDLMPNRTLRSARQAWDEFPSSTTMNMNKFDPNEILEMLHDPAGPSRPVDYQRALYEIRRTRKRQNQPHDDLPRPDLLELLGDTSHLKATDPKDMLFALLGLDEVCDVIVIPNYEDSESKIFTDFAVKCVETRLTLDILGKAGIGALQQGSTLPSWVPCPARLADKGEDLTCEEHHASGNYLRVPRLDATHSLLTTSGFVCDVITSYSSFTEPWRWSECQEKWSDLALNSPCSHPTGISNVQAFFRTMISDQSGYGYGKPKFKDEKDQAEFCELAKGFMMASGTVSLQRYNQGSDYLDNFSISQYGLDGHSMHAALLQCFLKLLPDESVAKTEKELLQPFLASTSQHGELEWQYDSAIVTSNEETRRAVNFCALARQATQRKSFFITESGYMGLGPALIENGDKICIIFGCAFPLLLRKDGDAYLLVGEAYIYGMMRGEMIAELEAGRFKEEEFVIK